MTNPEYTFMKLEDGAAVRVGEIISITPMYSSSNTAWKAKMKDGSIYILSQDEHDRLLKAFADPAYSIGLINLGK